jgi:hypothetical protein
VLGFGVFLRRTPVHPFGQLNRAGYAPFGATVAGVMLVTILVSALGTHRAIPRPHSPRAPTGGLASMLSNAGQTLRSRNFAVIAVAGMLHGINLGIHGGLDVYFSTYFWRLPAAKLLWLALAHLPANIVAAVVAPVPAKRWGKRDACVGLFLAAITLGNLPLAAGLLGWMPAAGSIAQFAILLADRLVIAAIGTAGFVIVTSMVADIVEETEVRTGRRSEGLLIAADTFLQKLSAGMAIAVPGFLLALVGFPAHADPATLDPQVIRRLAFISLPLWVALGVAATSVLVFYRIDRRTHEANLVRLAAEATGGVEDANTSGLVSRRTMIAGTAALVALGSEKPSAAQSRNMERDAFAAWLYVLPLIEMAGVRARLSAREPERTTVPSNVLMYAPGLPGPATRSITTPNRDTLDASAFIDLTQGPVTLRLPATGQRYFSAAAIDIYTNVNFLLGARTTGDIAGTYRLLGPQHNPQGDRDLRLATPHGWLLVRVLADGDEDLDAARQIQRAVILNGVPVRPTQLYATRAADWTDYFRSAQNLPASNPPVFKRGYDAFLRLRRASSSGDFARAGYRREDAAAIDKGVARACALVKAPHRNFIEGWSYPPPSLGNFGDHFIFRAIVAVQGLGALPRREAMYMRASGDDGSGLFHDDGLYRLNLKKPVPAKAFWSLTMYRATADGQYFLAPNTLGRYAIGDRTAGLMHNRDGSLDIWIGRHDPGDARRANWLPAPASGPFALTLRAYWPERELLDGGYRLPPIMPAS